MTTIQAFLLALVQGLTEFLPVSSSGHLVLAEKILGVSGDSFTFILVVHVASALAILLFFSKTLVGLTKKLWLPVLIGTIPAVVAGVLFKDALESLFAGESLIALGFLITAIGNAGIHFILKSQVKKELSGADHAKTASEAYEHEPLKVTWWQAIVVGIAQAIAIIPSISRSGATVFAGLVVGLSRKTAFEFSFLLALPAIGGATLLHLVDELSATGGLPADIFALPNLIGFFVSFIVSYLSLGLLKFMMKEAKFWWFVVYCLLIAVVSVFI